MRFGAGCLQSPRLQAANCKPMKTKPYTQRQLDRAQRRALEVQKTHGTSAKVGESGRCTMNIPQEAYFNAIDTEGGVIDGKTVWSDSGYRRDMCRRHPELVVKAAGSDSRVGPLLRRGPKTCELFRGKFDDVEADHGAFLRSQGELLSR